MSIKNHKDLPENCALAKKVWRRSYNGVDGRAPTTYKYTEDQDTAQEWQDDNYTSSVNRVWRFTLPSGKVFYAATVEPVEDVNQKRLQEQALEKLTDEEIQALRSEGLPEKM